MGGQPNRCAIGTGLPVCQPQHGRDYLHDWGPAAPADPGPPVCRSTGSVYSARSSQASAGRATRTARLSPARSSRRAKRPRGARLGPRCRRHGKQGAAQRPRRRGEPVAPEKGSGPLSISGLIGRGEGRRPQAPTGCRCPIPGGRGRRTQRRRGARAAGRRPTPRRARWNVLIFALPASRSPARR
jgi:hypothetical protein